LGSAGRVVRPRTSRRSTNVDVATTALPQLLQGDPPGGELIDGPGVESVVERLTAFVPAVAPAGALVLSAPRPARRQAGPLW
jgi:hypothetical protein